MLKVQEKESGNDSNRLDEKCIAVMVRSLENKHKITNQHKNVSVKIQ